MDNNDSAIFTISIVFLILTTSFIIIFILYFLFWKPSSNNTVQCVNNKCDITQVCRSGFCQEISCSNDADCLGNGLCIDSYCTPYNCLSGNDCPTGMACIDSVCNRTGSSCSSTNECINLVCMNNLCVQCLSNSNCPVGQGCFGQSCRFPYQSESSPGELNFVSPAQNNGIITAPPGYFCSTTTCGTGHNNEVIIPCSSDSACPAQCQFCVNFVCRCTSGQVTEKCVSNNDCLSGVCDKNNTCIASGNQCFSNYNGSTGSCPITMPYCVNGTCSPVSLGAICGSANLPPNLCNDPQSLGVTGLTGISPNGMGFFCINGTCQETPGGLNDLCTAGSCEFIENSVFVCVAVETPSIPQMRCMI